MITRIIFCCLTIITFLVIESRSNIPNCLFVNTVNLTTTNYTTFSNNSTESKNVLNLVATYDYIVLSNGSSISVPPHKRRCMCPDPCLNICSVNPLETYYEDDEMKPSFERQVVLKNGEEETKDFVKYFNQRIIKPCTSMYPLVMELYPNDYWSIFENGSLLLHYSNSYRNHDEYCFNWKDVNEGGYEGTLFVPYVCSLVNKNFYHDQIKNWAMVCSIPFFIMTILFYCFLPELKSCHGKCFVIYLVYLALTYALVSYNNLSTREFEETECLTIGYAIYFATIGFLTWISIISYDTFTALTGFTYSTLFRIYFFCGLIIPLIATFVVYLIQCLDIDDHLKPGIEIGNCGVNTDRWSATLYYYVPHIAVLIFCLTMYIKLIRFLVAHERNASTYTSRVKTSYKKRFSLYFRLFIFMGVVWFLEILSYFTDMMLENDTNLTLIPDLFNALHGIFVFCSIIGSSRICHDVKKNLTNNRFAEHELITTSSLVGAIDDDDD